MEKTPYFSIICPFYNSYPFLKKAIESVINQSFSDWELILVNDCSTDNSLDICRKYNDKRIKILSNDRNMGQGLSRNKGLDCSRGVYVTFLDSDDWLDPSYLEEASACLLKENPDLMSTNFRYMQNSKLINITLVDSFESYSAEKTYELYLQGQKIHSAPWGKFYHQRLLETIRFPQFLAREDIYFINNIIPHCKKIIFSPMFGYVSMIRTGSTENSGFNVAKLSTIESAHFAIRNCIEYFPTIVNLAKSYAAHLYFCVINDIIRSRYYKSNHECFGDLLNEYAEYMPFTLNKMERALGRLLIKNVKFYILLCRIGIIRK